MHTWTGLLGTPVYRHTLFQNKGKLSWERSQGSQGIMRSPESANWKIIQPPQGRRATRPKYLHTDSLSGAYVLTPPHKLMGPRQEAIAEGYRVDLS